MLPNTVYFREWIDPESYGLTDTKGNTYSGRLPESSSCRPGGERSYNRVYSLAWNPWDPHVAKAGH